MNPGRLLLFSLLVPFFGFSCASDFKGDREYPSSHSEERAQSDLSEEHQSHKNQTLLQRDIIEEEEVENEGDIIDVNDRNERDLLREHNPEEWAILRGKRYIKHYSAVELGLSGENVSALLIDNDDLWIGTWSGGLARMSIPTESVRVWDPGLPSLAVRTVNRIRRNRNSIFVIRYGAMEEYDRRTALLAGVEDLPVNERLQDVAFIGEKTYLATLGRGLWEKSTKEEWILLEKPGPFITRLETQDGKLLVATMDQGFYVYDADNDSWEEPPYGPIRQTNVTSILHLQGRYIGGTYGSGAFLWDKTIRNGRLFGNDYLGDLFVLAVLSHDFRVYFGTFGGGLRSWHPATDTWDSISLPEGFKSPDVTSLASGLNSIWVGTLGGGIVRVNEEIHGF